MPFRGVGVVDERAAKRLDTRMGLCVLLWEVGCFGAWSCFLVVSGMVGWLGMGDDFGFVGCVWLVHVVDAARVGW